MEDVEFTKDKVDLEIAKLRAYDSETSGTRSTFWSDKKHSPVQNKAVFWFIIKKSSFSNSLYCRMVLPQEKSFP